MAKLRICVLGIIAALQACPSDNGKGDGELGKEACPDRLRDTLGFEYGYDCESFELSIVPESPEPPMCGGSEVAVFRLRGAVGMPRICYFQTDPGSSSGVTSAEACRPIACDTRAECPGGVPCVRDICRLDPLELTEDSAFALCLSDIPWAEQCLLDAFHPDFADRIEPLLEACPDEGDSCSLPPECPQ